MKALFIEPFAGISGNMMLGALIDAGVPFAYLEEEFRKLHLGENMNMSMNMITVTGIIMSMNMTMLIQGKRFMTMHGCMPMALPTVTVK